MIDDPLEVTRTTAEVAQVHEKIKGIDPDLITNGSETEELYEFLMFLGFPTF